MAPDTPADPPTRTRRSAADFIPADADTLGALAAAVCRCEGCDLYLDATQAVFGEGPRDAAVMFVGEQPGDAEDRAGRPFVGPAGRLFGEVLAEVGLDRTTVYITNTVKHFKWERNPVSVHRRLHKKPSAREIAACVPWLRREIEIVRPRVLVALGATAAHALLGPSFKVSEQRGVAVPSPLAEIVVATVHPSSLLRAPDADTRRRERARFADDLRRIASYL